MDATTDGRLRRGDLTRRTVLKRAVDIASIQGLEGLSIGQLAADLEISKSGLFAHFGAKEELQLATIRAARRIYSDTVVAPAMAGTGRPGAHLGPERGLARLLPRPGLPGRLLLRQGDPRLRRAPGQGARRTGRGERRVDGDRGGGRRGGSGRSDTWCRRPTRAQLAFELNAYYEGANLLSLLRDADGSAYDLARRSIRARLEDFAAPGAPRPWK